MNPVATARAHALTDAGGGVILVVATGATRFRRKLSRPEGMPGATCPQSGGTVQLATLSWLSLPNQK
jgi:hypothetical protein